MPLLVYLLLGLLAITLLVKIMDTVLFNIFPILVNGKGWVKDFHRDLEAHDYGTTIKRHLERRSKSKVMMINRKISRLSPWLANYYYRWFVLAAILSCLLVCGASTIDEPAIIIITSILYLSLIVEVLNEVIDRLCLGVTSNIQVNTHIDVSAMDYDKLNWNLTEIIRRCVLGLIIRVFVIWVSFAALYFALNHRDPGAINGVKNIVDCVYFSLVTLTTTGFGDMSAISNTAKLYVCTEIVLAWLLIVVVVFHYAATLTIDLGGTSKGSGLPSS